LGRFMSEDPKLFEAGDYNLYRYCHNDPLDLTDPMGLEPPGVKTAPTPAPKQQTNAQQNVTKGQTQAQKAQEAGGTIVGKGKLLADTDGTGRSYGDPTHQPQASGMMNAQGQVVPRKADQVGRNGNRDLNADSDRYVTLPADLHGTLRIGDRATVILGDGRQQTGPLADVG